MKYNRITAYACSFGLHGAIEPDIPFVHENSWIDMLGKHYGIPVDNRSLPGTNPDIQFRKILDHIRDGVIQPTDFVLIQWTFVERTYSEKYNTIMPAYHDDGPLDKKDRAGVEWFYHHIYDDEYYMNKLLSYVHTIDALLPNVHHSFASGLKRVIRTGHITLKNKLKETKYIGVNDINFIFMLRELGHSEGNTYRYIYPCGHPRVNGHRVIADRYIETTHNYLI